MIKLAYCNVDDLNLKIGYNLVPQDRKNKINTFRFDKDKKLHIDFAKMQSGSRSLLEKIIEVQLSKSPEFAKEFVDKWTTWGKMSQYIAEFKQSLGIKPYIDIVTAF